LARRQLLTGALGLAAAGGLAGIARADVAPDGDLAYLRLLVGAELLKADFEPRALATAKLDVLTRMHVADVAHYNSLATLLGRSGQIAATAADINFSYPRNSFASSTNVVKLAVTLTTMTLGAYLGAVENVQTPTLRLPLAQIAANEAQQLSALSLLDGRDIVGPAFAPSLQIEAASAALGKYES
ncbi:MAG TPA: ferritin-like domain-containing protein, partial [Gaiellaceae bacterium]